MHIALYQPEIPQNVGALLRSCACLGVPAHIVHPCGFPFDSTKIKRALMDYWPFVTLTHHNDWRTFTDSTHKQRLVLLDVVGSTPYTEFYFQKNDIIVAGRESDGFPDSIKQTTKHSVHIPMMPERRSLNVATALSMVLGEALRQTKHFPMPEKTPQPQSHTN